MCACVCVCVVKSTDLARTSSSPVFSSTQHHGEYECMFCTSRDHLWCNPSAAIPDLFLFLSIESNAFVISIEITGCCGSIMLQVV
jgi:hypothetical protein